MVVDDRATRLESLLPGIMRVLFRTDPNDPLSELPIAQLRMMRLLRAGERLPSALGAELGLSASAITQLANRMESIGYVERVPDPEDRRVRRLRLTEHARCLMEERRQNRTERARTVLQTIPEASQDKILEALECLLTACHNAPDSKSADSLFVVAEIEQQLPPNPQSS